QANGRVYLINQNGIVFGQGAQVNVGSLVASSLDVSDDIFLNGILTAKDQSLSAFSGLNGFIRIEPGVNLSTLGGGQIWMFAPSIENNGLIHTPDGQT
ncbi:filamentous hemagglutinin N-terminal domain-containing protein, partial [Acinetobacter baumannii]